MSSIKTFLAIIGVAAFIAFAAAMFGIQQHYAVKICDQNGMDYSIWRGDKCVPRN